jgi:hypothetical protein
MAASLIRISNKTNEIIDVIKSKPSNCTYFAVPADWFRSVENFTKSPEAKNWPPRMNTTMFSKGLKGLLPGIDFIFVPELCFLNLLRIFGIVKSDKTNMPIAVVKRKHSDISKNPHKSTPLDLSKVDRLVISVAVGWLSYKPLSVYNFEEEKVKNNKFERIKYVVSWAVEVASTFEMIADTQVVFNCHTRAIAQLPSVLPFPSPPPELTINEVRQMLHQVEEYYHLVDLYWATVEKLKNLSGSLEDLEGFPVRVLDGAGGDSQLIFTKREDNEFENVAKSENVVSVGPPMKTLAKTPPKKSVVSPTDQHLCVICLDKEKSFMAFDCFHGLFCAECCDKFLKAGNTECPTCGVKFREIRQVFW